MILHHERVAPAGAPPSSWLLMTHGIYGSGGNWRSIARKLVERRPDWGAVLVDLRAHGRSPSGDPPHTVAACAADLAALVATLGDGGAAVTATCGHSFGGKVVLAHRATARLAQTWVLDASPGARPEVFDSSVGEVLELLERLPPRFAHRDDFIAAAVAAGQTPTLAGWLAMNLEPAGDGGLRLRLDLAVIRTLLDDYARADLWSVIEDAAIPGELHVVAAGASPTVSADDRARLITSPAHLHVIPDAGHWLNVTAPTEVLDLLATHLPTG